MTDMEEIELKIERVTSLVHQKEFEEAEKLVMEIQEEVGFSLDLICILAHIKIRRNSLDDAEELLLETLDIDESSCLWSALGKVYTQKEEKNEAVHAYEKAIELDPEDYESLLGLGTNLYYLGKFDEAGEYIKRAIKLNPIASWPYIMLGFVEMLRLDLEESESMFRRAVQLEPNNALGWGMLEIVLGWQGNEAEAAKAEAKFHEVLKVWRMQDP